MSRDTPRMTIAKPDRANNVLAGPTTTTQRKPSRSNSQSNKVRAAATKLKLVVRRLPPGLTQHEFEEALGKDWKAGGALVDWAAYKEGKISKERVHGR